MAYDVNHASGLTQVGVWDTHAAQTYDSPGEDMFAPEVLGPTVDLLTDLADGGDVLELAIGTGRVAIPLRDNGVRVAGIELSQPMIDRLREKADADRVPVVLGDMATARVPGEFSLAYLVFNTISNLLTQEEQVECFRNAARHLRPGGRFVVELGVPPLRVLAPGQQAAVFTVEEGYVGFDAIDVVTQRLVSMHVQFGEGREATIDRSPHRYVWPAELDLMGRLAGFALEQRYADWDRSPFTAESPSAVSVYRLAE